MHTIIMYMNRMVHHNTTTPLLFHIPKNEINIVCGLSAIKIEQIFTSELGFIKDYQLRAEEGEIRHVPALLLLFSMHALEIPGRENQPQWWETSVLSTL